MRRILKGTEPASLMEHRLAAGTGYDSYRDKDTLRTYLVTEQREFPATVLGWRLT